MILNGVIVQVGENIKDKLNVLDKFLLLPAVGLPSRYSSDYSYKYFGVYPTYCIMPNLRIDLEMYVKICKIII